METLLTLLQTGNVAEYLQNIPVWAQWLAAVGGFVMAAKPITVLTPTKIDDQLLAGFGKVYNAAQKVLNTVALNVGKDKNTDA